MSREKEPHPEPGSREGGGPDGEPPWEGWDWELERRRLRVLCWRHRVPVEEWEDLVHDAAARLFAAWQEGRVRSARAYLWGTLGRMCRMRQRAERRRRAVSLDEVPLEDVLPVLVGPDPRPGLAARLELAGLAAALPAWARRSLEAAALGLTVEESAAYVGIAPGSVRTYRRRAAALARKHLAKRRISRM